VEIFLDTGRFAGPKTSNLYLIMDNGKETVLTITAFSRGDVTVDPDRLSFGKVKPGETRTEQMTIVVASHPEVALTQVQCDSKYVLLAAKVLYRDGKFVEYLISATLRADIPAGKLDTDLWVSTNDADIGRVRVPVRVEVEAPAKVP